MFTGVLRVRDAISELKIERFQELVLKEVPFDHSEIFHTFAANSELDSIIKQKST